MASIAQDPLMGIQERTPLSTLFFHPKNIETIQAELQYRVYKKTKIRVGRQSDKELKIVMRSVYLQESVNQSRNIQDQISKLNESVLDYCVKNTVSNALQHKQYMQDASTLPVPMSHPVGTAGRNRFTFSLHPDESSANRSYSKYPYQGTLR
jgi:hypothetical protein